MIHESHGNRLHNPCATKVCYTGSPQAMKTMLFQPAQIKKLSPVAADLGATSGPLKRVRLGRGFHFAQHGQQPQRYRDGVRPSGSAFGHGKGYGFSCKVNAVQWNAGFFKSASGVESNFKADTHPVWDVRNGQGAADAGNVLVGKNRFSVNGRLAGSKVHHGHGSHVAKQPALPVDPLQNLNVLQGLVAADVGSVGSGRGRAPRNVFHGRGWSKVGQHNPAFVHKSRQVSPTVAVINFSVGRNLMIVEQSGHPGGVGQPLVALSDRKFGGLFNRLGSVKGVIGSVAGGSGLPNAVSVFVADPIPLAVASFKNRGHGTSVSNCLKIGKI